MFYRFLSEDPFGKALQSYEGFLNLANFLSDFNIVLTLGVELSFKHRGYNCFASPLLAVTPEKRVQR